MPIQDPVLESVMSIGIFILFYLCIFGKIKIYIQSVGNISKASKDLKKNSLFKFVYTVSTKISDAAPDASHLSLPYASVCVYIYE